MKNLRNMSSEGLMKIVSVSVISVVTCGLVACTDPGETTTMAAATGGVLGAGLGAIIGNQTGSTGGGLVLGAIAGAAAGGAVGNVIEGQEKTARLQDEAIERHERTIQAQRTELEELRQIHQDSGSVQRYNRGATQPVYVPHASLGRSTALPAVPDNRSARNFDRPTQAAMATKPVFPDSHSAGAVQAGAADRTAADVVRESTLVDRSNEYKSREDTSTDTDYRSHDDVHSNLAVPSSSRQPTRVQPFTSESRIAMGEAGQNAPVGIAMGAMNSGRANETKPANLGTAECNQAEGEISKASASSELADKLFHYRRALRLCPDNPSYHNGLGEIYLSLNRRNDAEFEFREALNLDPNYQPASNNLNALR